MITHDNPLSYTVGNTIINTLHNLLNLYDV
jgi:hypothetical protein